METRRRFGDDDDGLVEAGENMVAVVMESCLRLMPLMIR